MKKKAYIQGEVIIIQVDEATEPKAELNNTGIIATGETGNHHQLVGGKFQLFGNARAAGNLLKVIEPTQLVHGSPETTGHRPITLPSGTYSIKVQRERDLLSTRSRAVVD